jgi:hypothetical protein
LASGSAAAVATGNGIDTVLKPSTIIASVDSHKVAAASVKSRILREITERTEIEHAHEAEAEPSADMAQPEALSVNGKPGADSDKAFADARGLQALSELIAMSPGNGAAPPSSGLSSIAEEANTGQVLDMEPSAVHKNGEEPGAQAQNRTLLDRLRGAASSPAEAEK